MKRGEDGEKWSERERKEQVIKQQQTINTEGGGGQHTSLAVE
jgi:hypothetical protein